MASNPDPLKILVVDDEAAMREVLEARLTNWGYRVELAACGAAAKETVRRFEPHVVVSDLVLPDLTGLDLLSALQADDPDRFIILITAYGNIDSAVSAMKRGARDFLTKPLDYPALRALLQQAESERRARQAQQSAELAPPQDVDSNTSRATRSSGPAALKAQLVGASASHRHLTAMIEKVAKSDGNVLITGESGTGKEVVARTIHELGSREGGPFIAVNAAAIPEGLTEAELMGYERGAFTGAVSARMGFYEQANDGTLFLDEITEMPPPLQAKLLRGARRWTRATAWRAPRAPM
jgi:DNA-binding NtrC family response regulator